MIDDAHRLTTPEQLAAIYGQPNEASTNKEVGRVHPIYRPLIEASPFVVLATSGPGGLDASPRGDPAGSLVAIEDDGRTLLLPDRRGNNRIDSLRNIVADPRVGLLFLVPGLGETLRVNGRASLSVDPALLARFEMQGQRPRCIVVIAVETVFFQCARAIQRAGLWQPQAAPAGLPTPGTILSTLTEGGFDGATYDRELRPRQRATLY
jgi:PPOX class probable FMN-dependent enzyme